MIAISLSLILLGLWGQAPAVPTAGDYGTIAGVVRTASGAPAAGVRVTALSRPESPVGVASEASSVSLAETDERGSYRLENIPPGSYYIAAGRVSLPTYYPGTLEMQKGTAVSVTARAVVSNINFAMDDGSNRAPEASVDLSAVAGLTMPVQVRMEGNAKQPVFANGKSVAVRFTRKQDGMVSDTPLDASILNLLVPSSLPGYEYGVTVENLPNGYVVKSMTQDGVNLMSDTLKITARHFVQAPIQIIGASSPGALSNTVRMAYGAGGPMTPLEITLAGQSSGPANGVRIRGRITSTGSWEPGPEGSSSVLFADRSFEYRGVAPGRHVILLQDKMVSPARNLAASIAVGDKDLDDVAVEDTVVLPVEIRFPATTPQAGTVVPLAWIRGRVADDASKSPVLGGTVTLAGKTKATFPIDSEGQFEIPRLLPGAYELTIEGSRHAVQRQNVVVGDEDVHLDLLVRSNG